jgi:hypothetical protein
LQKLSDLTNKRFRALAGESGQGALEYILIMIVMVGIIVGLLIQFNRAFETYANNLFGEYLECLLETGELPALNSTDAESSVCSQFFSPFQAADLSGGPGGSNNPGGNNPGGNNGNNGSGNNNTNSSGGGGSTRARTSQSKLSEGAPSNSRSSGANTRGFSKISGYKPSRLRNQKSGTAGGGGDSIDTGSTDFSSMSYGSNRSGAPSVFKDDKGLEGGFRVAYSDEEDREAPIPMKAKAEELTKKEKQEVFKAKERKPASDGEIDADGDGFGIGGFLRWLIIAAIIIALVLFFGGQALQISKSID